MGHLRCRAWSYAMDVTGGFEEIRRVALALPPDERAQVAIAPGEASTTQQMTRMRSARRGQLSSGHGPMTSAAAGSRQFRWARLRLSVERPVTDYAGLRLTPGGARRVLLA